MYYVKKNLFKRVLLNDSNYKILHKNRNVLKLSNFIMYNLFFKSFQNYFKH